MGIMSSWSSKLLGSEVCLILKFVCLTSDDLLERWRLLCASSHLGYLTFAVGSCRQFVCRLASLLLFPFLSFFGFLKGVCELLPLRGVLVFYRVVFVGNYSLCCFIV